MKISRKDFVDVYGVIEVLINSTNKEVGWFAARNKRKMEKIIEEINIANQPSKEFVDFLTEAKLIANKYCAKNASGEFILSEDKKYTFVNEENKELYRKEQVDLHIKNERQLQDYELKTLKYMTEEIDYEPYKIKYESIPKEFSGQLMVILHDFIEE